MKGVLQIEVNELTEAQAKKYLQELIDFLDDADDEDVFGTEGWRYRLWG